MFSTLSAPPVHNGPAVRLTMNIFTNRIAANISRTAASVAACVLIGACATAPPYLNVAGPESATLTVENRSGGPLVLLGSQRGDCTDFYPFGGQKENHVLEAGRSVQTSLDPASFFIIAASAVRGASSCGIYTAIKPSPGGRYVATMTRDGRGCRFDIRQDGGDSAARAEVREVNTAGLLFGPVRCSVKQP